MDQVHRVGDSIPFGSILRPHSDKELPTVLEQFHARDGDGRCEPIRLKHRGGRDVIEPLEEVSSILIAGSGGLRRPG
jgi:hypothetical protein